MIRDTTFAAGTQTEVQNWKVLIMIRTLDQKICVAPLDMAQRLALIPCVPAPSGVFLPVLYLLAYQDEPRRAHTTVHEYTTGEVLID